VQKARVKGLDERIYTTPKQEAPAQSPEAKDLFGCPRVHQPPKVNILDSHYLILIFGKSPQKDKIIDGQNNSD
jgi:hypothetical protein